MSYVVAIRNNATGEIRNRVVADLEWNEGSIFLWTEGNFSCDCNRLLDWVRASGEEPDIDGAHCGFGGFSVLHAELPDGTVVPLDEESP